eukprot:SAG31_NODE_3037_length_4761_cov_2.884384_1_plen_118_part_00
MCPLLEKHGTCIERCNALIEKVSPCIESGLLDVCTTVMKAWEALGAGPDRSAGVKAYLVWFLSSLDYRKSDVARQKIGAVPSALRYMLEHPDQGHLVSALWWRIAAPDSLNRANNRR